MKMQHDLILISKDDLYKFDTRIIYEKKYYMCSKCNLRVFKHNLNDEECYYINEGTTDSAIVNITCAEYMIKKLLE